MEGGIRVPFIVSGPGIQKMSESKVPVVGYDILPTIVDLAGSDIQNKEDIDGGSFKKILLSGKDVEINRHYPGIIFHVPYENKIALARAHSSIIKNNFKLIKFRNNNELVLYDIDNDFMEAENLLEQYPELTDELESLLDGYLFKFKSLKWQNGINWKNVNVNKVNSFYE
jgi:arylsulfatase A-like enzyme